MVREHRPRLASELEHYWRITTLPGRPGTTFTLNMVARHSANAEGDNFERRTFTLLVNDEELEGILQRLNGEAVPYGSETDQVGNHQLNKRGGGRGLFFRDPNGHTFEITTVAYHLV